MPKQVNAWLSEDGVPHLTEQAAKDRDFECALKAWWASAIPGDGDDMPSTFWLEKLFEDRMKLLAIYKLLNGSSMPVTPPLPTPPSTQTEGTEQ